MTIGTLFNRDGDDRAKLLTEEEKDQIEAEFKIFHQELLQLKETIGGRIWIRYSKYKYM